MGGAMNAFVGFLHVPGATPDRQNLRKQAVPPADAVGFLHVGRSQPVRRDITFDRPGDQGALSKAGHGA